MINLFYQVVFLVIQYTVCFNDYSSEWLGNCETHDVRL